LHLLLPGDPYTQTGGYIYDRRLADGLGRLGWRVAVHSLDSSFPRPTAAALRQARGMLAGISAGSVVVVDGLALAGLSKVLQAQAKRLALVGLVHHPLALETGLDGRSAGILREAERASFAVVNLVVVTSKWTARALGSYRVASDRIRVVEPGVDDSLRAHGKHVEHRNTRRKTSVNLLCVATLTPRKGHAVLFNALARLRNRHWHLNCVGSLTRDPVTARALRRLIARLGLGERISLLGEVTPRELERHYARCDVFVLASYMEGYGMALAEAVSHGIPIVSTRAGAIPETVPVNAGLLVQPGDSVELAQVLAKVMDDPAVRRTLSINAMAARKTLRTWVQTSEQFAAALRDLAVTREP
jgi:glycosyltransferase involved in cell wall biosynthesis